jgi:hypothetical protein
VDDGDRVRFRGERNITIDHRLHVEFKSVGFLPIKDDIVRRFFLPTRGVTVKYIRPEKSPEPFMYLFALQKGGVDEPERKSKLVEWRMPFLFVPGQGFALTWPKSNGK